MLLTQNLTSNNFRSPLSILMYSHDGFGLGHLKRNYTIAQALTTQFPTSNALLIMGHAELPFRNIPKNIDFIKLPSIVKVDHEVWQPRSLPLDAETTKKFRSSLILNIVEHYKPNIFLVDYVPKGVWGELIPTLSYLKTQSPKTRIVLGLRDIIDDPMRTRQRWESGHTYEVIEKFYDEVLIYGSQQLYDTAEQYGLSPAIQKKVHYCGYVCAGEPQITKEQVRQRLGINGKTFIVVTAGGGKDAFPMMKYTLQGLTAIKNTLSFEALIITGPLMCPKERHILQALAVETNSSVIDSTPDILNYMNSADLLITMGSYNTLMEALKLKKRLLVIPRKEPSAEQHIRSNLFAQKGLLNCINDPENLSAIDIGKEILSALNMPPQGFSLNFKGVEHVVSRLIAHLPKKEETIIKTA